MKRLLPFVFLLISTYIFAQNEDARTMPPEDTRPDTNLWWILGVIIAIGLGMVLYILIKKNPKKDVQ
ncbi:MAG: hypothetical protein JWQ96_1471 [Segetibacter sp.]|nr:hypothetical protein [Segetibacter sp.]